MNTKEFKQLALTYFGDVLTPYGFSSKDSEYCTFSRMRGDLCDIIMPILSRDGSSFIIRVFVTSPVIDPAFEMRFPDTLGIPSDVCSALHPKHGVHFREHKYRCKYEEGFIRNFQNDAKPALLDKALPYLDAITKVEDLLPYMKHPFFVAAVSWHANKKRDIKSLLENEQKRLSSIQNTTGGVEIYLQYVEGLLAQVE
ncbi:hypothetical protein [Catenovulum sediminis]|uniref:hypothetical protein n=1 Tax=Catenovulum sediminis TaxID=1740262 RepID=UPI00118164B5|nr:hypothetical protein [Catenovulum sediminis]